MKAHPWFVGLVCVGLLLLAFASGSASAAQRAAVQAASPVGTAFTFQGRLTFDDRPVEDSCLMRFELYDAASGGSQVGPTINPPAAIAVHNGLFSVELDFGSVFSGSAVWLDIAVQCSGDSGYSSLGRQQVTSVPYAVHSDLLGGNSSAFYRDASNLNAGTLSRNLYSAFGDLGLEGYLGNESSDLAQNNGTLQTNLNADLLDSVQGSLYERSYSEGTVMQGNSLAIEIPHYYPFTLQLASGWPDTGGVAFVTGMENDWLVAITYVAYNGDGTSQTGGAECSEASSTVLLTFGNGSYTYQIKCPGEASGVHNLLLVVPGSSVELRYKIVY